MDLFERSLPQRLTNLRYQLLSGRYRPDPIVNFRLPKPGGGYRVLSILTVRDRVAQRVALNVIVPLSSRNFCPAALVSDLTALPEPRWMRLKKSIGKATVGRWMPT
ncbi:MAG: hypothetical protein HXX08_07455 [Chloroflexi bacterium]|uniref:Uncharacterized protein n=1 Tax=Candidatus Chlorohelix allophototropha TaxID=3003348 RepID=A0A8T7M145_9CHLR|nr:hypothetical protein [Chloroflexota bacterium]WJW67568.1 hypothetical protein OZ401_000835 [Chloroflexota bacterium L227-S17]